MAATPEFRYTFVIPFGGIEDGYVEGRFDGTGLTGSKLSTQGEGPREVSGTLRARFVERSGAGRASSRR